MSSLPTVSVLLATFNGCRFIKDQLISLGGQTLQPTELLVCDDGSDDATLGMVTAFARTAPFPIRIVRNPERLGYADNFLHGASLCTGELIAFCDQDDVWHRAKLQRCVEVIQQADALLVIHNASVVDQNLRFLGRSKPAFLHTEVLPARGCELTMTLPGFAMVFSADLIRGLDPRCRPVDYLQATRPLLAHDQWIVFLARSAGNVVHLAETLAWYRQHAANTCGAAAAPPAPKVTLKSEMNYTAYLRRADASEYYGTALDAVATAPASRQAGARWRESAAHYRNLAESYRLRARLYDRTGTRLEHVRALVRLLMRRAYRSKLTGGLGWRAVLKDGASLLQSSQLQPTPRDSASIHRAH